MAKTLHLTNLCPKKLFWELSHLSTFEHVTQEWWLFPNVLLQQLQLLKKAQISTIKVNIFNTELTTDGEKIDWTPIDLYIDLAQQAGLTTQLCLGPYQYPLWPGIRLPHAVQKGIKKEKELDKYKQIKAFGLYFLEECLKRYGKHKNITGFYLGNEWHTAQAIEEMESQGLYSISNKHMESMIRLCKKLTRRHIFFNTNADASEPKAIEHAFRTFSKLLKHQFYLGLDIYPSQETLMKAPKLLFHRKFHAFSTDVAVLQEKFSQRVVVSEFEAQPWGNGQSWGEQIEQHQKIVLDTAKTLTESYAKYIKPAQFESVTFWGAEFWLVAYYMGHPQMLDAVAELKEL